MKVEILADWWFMFLNNMNVYFDLDVVVKTCEYASGTEL